MEIKEMLISPSKWTRPQTPMKTVKAVVMHWTANARANAVQNRNFFNNRKDSYGSAHYIVGQDGEVIRCVPENEVAYHSGSGGDKAKCPQCLDPASGRNYTDEARKRFGCYGNGECVNPNTCTIGIELCNADDAGNFTEATIKSAVELTADILKRHGLGVDAVTTHHNLVGWKDCPRLWTNKPELFEAFKADVARTLA